MRPDRLTRVLGYTIAVTFVLLPFHALLTTWAGATFGHSDLIRIWKELLLVPVTLAVGWTIYKDVQLRQKLIKSKLLYLVMLYVLLTIILGTVALLAHRVNPNALIYGLIINLRFVIFMIDVWVIGLRHGWLAGKWSKAILVPAAIVVVFGLFQHFVLPTNFLTHFGYGPRTIPSYQTVDQKVAYVRVQSTLRGPNPFAAYLVIVITFLAGFGLYDKKRRVWWLGLLTASVVTLFFTYSRSAWIGTVLSLTLLFYWCIQSKALKRNLIIMATVLAVACGGLVLGLRHNHQVENTFFHTDETSHSPVSSNQARSSALRSGISDVIHQPLGRGPGTAGPASVRNNHPARIAENYFIQIGQEVGIAGLIVFVAMNAMLARSLWQRRDNLLAITLLASLVGITCINLLTHAWADDTLSLIWWGLAGIALSMPQAYTKQKAKAV
jgi:hypothetical protein